MSKSNFQEDNFLPPSHLMEFSIRLLDRTGDIFKHKVIHKYTIN